MVVVSGLALFAPVPAHASLRTLTLKSVAQVATEDVTLRDLVVANGEEDFPGSMVICHTPNAGTVRTISAAEIAALLKKHDASFSLRGAEQISVMRVGRKISGDDLLPLVVAALNSGNSKAQISNVQLQAAIFVSDARELKLRKLRFDPAVQKYRAWFVVSGAAHATTFEALVTLEPGTAPLQVGSGKEEKVSVTSSVLVHRGEPAAMQLDGEGFSATLEVICLEDGTAARAVRVREKATKRIYRAEVVGRGQLRAVSQEN